LRDRALGEFVAWGAVNETVVAEEKVRCRPHCWADLFTEVCFPASSFSSESGTEKAVKSLVCAYVTPSSGFVLFLLEFLELVVPEGD